MEEIKHSIEKNLEDDPGIIENSFNDEILLLNINGYEGAIDLLLDLARRQKVDLLSISILELAEQYLEYVKNASKLNLELASDYLVMAAWLAFLKSKILLPEEEEEEISGEDLAKALKIQLSKLQAMRDAGKKLFQLDLLFIDRFPKGIISKEVKIIKIEDNTNLNDLLFSYSNIIRGKNLKDYEPPVKKLETIESALKRLNKLLNTDKDWQQLSLFLPEDLDKNDKVFNSSVLSATFSATLELAKKGKVEIRQLNAFGEIFIRNKMEI
ncbi:MAG: segregation/condensation protein A [Pelagibacterales bacterium]|nr:segregation/condensation protein A [Pelagibacterales bacterium]PPR16461.1 MAG: Segregation and condensation protein A [Alphaproteobacteria bacterium MarineAlpha9_Bin3]|tara:strand:+ start:4714 stop:5520 length:807 start_codon:yes stop_codon:yes gene_type:complete